jgi:hypothetical protein
MSNPLLVGVDVHHRFYPHPGSKYEHLTLLSLVILRRVDLFR